MAEEKTEFIILSFKKLYENWSEYCLILPSYQRSFIKSKEEILGILKAFQGPTFPTILAHRPSSRTLKGYYEFNYKEVPAQKNYRKPIYKDEILPENSILIDDGQQRITSLMLSAAGCLTEDNNKYYVYYDAATDDFIFDNRENEEPLDSCIFPISFILAFETEKEIRGLLGARALFKMYPKKLENFIRVWRNFVLKENLFLKVDSGYSEDEYSEGFVITNSKASKISRIEMNFYSLGSELKNYFINLSDKTAEVGCQIPEHELLEIAFAFYDYKSWKPNTTEEKKQEFKEVFTNGKEKFKKNIEKAVRDCHRWITEFERGSNYI